MKLFYFFLIFLVQTSAWAQASFPIDRALTAKFDCSTLPGDGDYVLLRVYQEKKDDGEQGLSVVMIEKTFELNQQVVTHTGWFEGYASSDDGIAAIRSPISGSLTITSDWTAKLDYAQLNLLSTNLICKSSYE